MYTEELIKNLQKLHEDIFTPVSEEDIKKRERVKQLEKDKIYKIVKEFTSSLNSKHPNLIIQYLKFNPKSFPVILSIHAGNFNGNMQVVFFDDGEVMTDYRGMTRILNISDKDIIWKLTNYIEIKLKLIKLQEDIFTPISQDDLNKRKEIRNQELNKYRKQTLVVAEELTKELSKYYKNIRLSPSSGELGFPIIYLDTYFGQTIYFDISSVDSSWYSWIRLYSVSEVFYPDKDDSYKIIKDIVSFVKRYKGINEDIFTPASQKDIEDRTKAKDEELKKLSLKMYEIKNKIQEVYPQAVIKVIIPKKGIDRYDIIGYLDIDITIHGNIHFFETMSFWGDGRIYLNKTFTIAHTQEEVLNALDILYKKLIKRLQENKEMIKESDNLNEGLKQAKEKYIDTHKIPEPIFHMFIQQDPTKQKKYIEWICKVYLEHPESGFIGKLAALKDFERLVQRHIIKGEEADLSRHSTLESLVDVVNKYTMTAAPTKAEAIVDGAELILDNGKVKIYRVKTYEASCVLGTNTTWCTASSSSHYFHDYFSNRFAEIYYIIPQGELAKKYGKYAVVPSQPKRNSDGNMICKNCGSALVEVQSEDGKRKYKHVPPFTPEKKDCPEPFPEGYREIRDRVNSAITPEDFSKLAKEVFGFKFDSK